MSSDYLEFEGTYWFLWTGRHQGHLTCPCLPFSLLWAILLFFAIIQVLGAGRIAVALTYIWQKSMDQRLPWPAEETR
jgi:hypothetical protein